MPKSAQLPQALHASILPSTFFLSSHQMIPNTQTHAYPIDWFRHCAPYINTHRGKTFVIVFDDDAVSHPCFDTLIHDFALLHSLGIRLVLVHGAKHRLDQALQDAGLPNQIHNGTRITTPQAMDTVCAVVGSIRLQIESYLSMGLVNSPMHQAGIAVVSGNFITARPVGILQGVDHQMTGQVRSVNVHAINHNLDHDHVVILSPIGFAATGELFSLSAQDVALHTAMALKADKLILFNDQMLCQDGAWVRELTTHQALQLLDDDAIDPTLRECLLHATIACEHIARTHILPFNQDGVLVQELFTTDGAGLLISQDPFDKIRHADVDDILPLMSLLKPLQDKGILIERSQSQLQADIEHYSVIERDGIIIGCAALYPLDDDCAEIASIAIHPDYRGGSHGTDLLDFVSRQAKKSGFKHLFALTTHTAHWFLEHGFVPSDVSHLPQTRQQKYHNGRNSKVCVKSL